MERIAGSAASLPNAAAASGMPMNAVLAQVAFMQRIESSARRPG